MVTTRPPKTIVKLTALGPVANTDTKLLTYGLFQKGRVFGTGRGSMLVLLTCRSGGSAPRHWWYSRPFGVTAITLDPSSYVIKWCASSALIIACRSYAEGTIGKKNES